MPNKKLVKLIVVASNFFFEMILALGLGFFLGRIIDDYFETEFIFMTILMVVFMLSAIFIFIRRLIKLGNQNE